MYCTAKCVTTLFRSVKTAKWFTVIADEVTDLSNREQLSIVLWYVDSTYFNDSEGVSCGGISGRHLADKVSPRFNIYRISAGKHTMAGSVRAALIQRNHLMAVYLYTLLCITLAVVKSFTVTSVRNMIGIVGRVYQFFAAKRHRALEQANSDCHPTSSSHKLKDMCHTRWVQRIAAADTFQCLLTSVVDCLEKMCDDGSSLWSSDSLADTQSLQLAMCFHYYGTLVYNFISTGLGLKCAILKYIQALTTSLQA